MSDLVKVECRDEASAAYVMQSLCGPRMVRRGTAVVLPRSASPAASYLAHGWVVEATDDDRRAYRGE